MHILWGCLIAAAGFYRLMVARSKILWGENVHKFHQIAGAMVIIFGLLVVFGYIPTR